MKTYKLLTRADLDGVMSAVLLKKFGLVDEVQFCHPKDVQDGIIPVSENDIITNLPYSENAKFVFDHHFYDDVRAYNKKSNHIINPVAKSATRVIYEYFGGADKFPSEWQELVKAVDKMDSGDLTEDEIVNPSGFLLLNYILDPRTGLGRYDSQFRLKNFEFMHYIIDLMQTTTDIDDILGMPDVKARIDFYKNEQILFKDQLKKCSTVYDNVVLVNYKDEETIHVGNRFLIYTMYPSCDVSIHKIMGNNKDKTVFAVGKSIINRNSQANISEIMSMHGGGGHRNAGTCQVLHKDADKTLKAILDELNVCVH
ncbi:MAG: exopolyphosphatase [Candidatus Gastranaerophilaceae bacterium]